jgi:hypothetical protein
MTASIQVQCFDLVALADNPGESTLNYIMYDWLQTVQVKPVH